MVQFYYPCTFSSVYINPTHTDNFINIYIKYIAPTNQAGNCVQQDECIDVDIQKTVISSGWEVCFDDITLKDSWASGSYGKLCKTVECGASATFGIADGCGCKSNGDTLSTVFIRVIIE